MVNTLMVLWNGLLKLKVICGFSQAKIDYIVEKAADHFLLESTKLGQLAHDETGMGVPKDKDAKNVFAADYIRRCKLDLWCFLSSYSYMNR